MFVLYAIYCNVHYKVNWKFFVFFTLRLLAVVFIPMVSFRNPRDKNRDEQPSVNCVTVQAEFRVEIHYSVIIFLQVCCFRPCGVKP